MLPIAITEFLEQAARSARTVMPEPNSSLFAAGVLDSFSLVDFVTLLEKECGIRIADADLRPENFDTLAKVDSFVNKAKAA